MWLAHTGSAHVLRETESGMEVERRRSSRDGTPVEPVQHDVHLSDAFVDGVVGLAQAWPGARRVAVGGTNRGHGDAMARRARSPFSKKVESKRAGVGSPFGRSHVCEA